SNSEKQKRSQLELVRTELRPKLAEGASSHTDILGQSGATAEVGLRKPVDISQFDHSHRQPSPFTLVISILAPQPASTRGRQLRPEGHRGLSIPEEPSGVSLFHPCPPLRGCVFAMPRRRGLRISP